MNYANKSNVSRNSTPTTKGSFEENLESCFTKAKHQPFLLTKNKNHISKIVPIVLKTCLEVFLIKKRKKINILQESCQEVMLLKKET